MVSRLILRRGEKVKDSLIAVLFIGFIIVTNVLGLWFLMGGDLLDLMNGCFNAKGC